MSVGSFSRTAAGNRAYPGGLYSEGRFNGGFFCVMVFGGLYLEGLIHGGAYFQKFMVLSMLRSDWLSYY